MRSASDAVPTAALVTLLLGAPSSADEAARIVEAACPALQHAKGSALIAISGRDFEGAAIAIDGARTVAVGEPGGRCLVFVSRDPDRPIEAGEMNVVAEPDAPEPANNQSPSIVVSVLDPPLAPFLATRGTLHVSEDDPGLRATFRLQLDHGEVSFTVMGRFSLPGP